MYVGIHLKYPLFLSDFNETWIFSRDFLKTTQISNFMRICPVGAEVFHAERAWNELLNFLCKRDMTVDFSRGLKCTLGCKKLRAALNIMVGLHSHRGTPIEKQRHKQHFIFQLMHTTLKNGEIVKHFKIRKTAPTCFGLQGNHHQGTAAST